MYIELEFQVKVRAQIVHKTSKKGPQTHSTFTLIVFTANPLLTRSTHLASIPGPFDSKGGLGSRLIVVTLYLCIYICTYMYSPSIIHCTSRLMGPKVHCICFNLC